MQLNGTETCRGLRDSLKTWAEHKGTVKALLVCKPVIQAFLELDADLLTAAFYADSTFGESALCSSRRNAHSSEAWECGMEKEDGPTCMALFSTRNQMVAHQSFHHGTEHPIIKCVQKMPVQTALLASPLQQLLNSI